MVIKKPRPKRGVAILTSVARDLRYEWDMARTSALLLHRAAEDRNQLLVNVFLEDFLLHARNLRDFFAPSARPDDVLACDFLGSTPRLALPHLRSTEIRNRLNRRISHLSFTRPRFRAGWNVPRLLREIDAAMIFFVARLRMAHPTIAAPVFGAG